MSLKRPIDWENEWFPIDDATYLNFAAHAAIPRVALNAVQTSVAAKMRPPGKIRVAPHLLNSTEDIDRLLFVMEKAQKEAGYVPH
jgi:selenocysteine lyase/cysteine desulfurase